MLARTGLEPQEALVCTMVLVAATGGGITDREIGMMAGLVQTLPAFRDFSTERLRAATDAAVGLLDEEEGLAHAARLIRAALEPRLRETAYTLACEVVAADLQHGQPILQMLAFLGEELGVDRLFVDEAHYFKNLFYVSKMTRIAGLPQTASERAFDMFLKVRHVQSLNGGGGVVFATGTLTTPVLDIVAVPELTTLPPAVGAML